jgi:hypothetical protein
VGGFGDRSLKNLLSGNNRVEKPALKRAQCRSKWASIGTPWEPTFHGTKDKQEMYTKWFDDYKRDHYDEVKKALEQENNHSFLQENNHSFLQENNHSFLQDKTYPFGVQNNDIMVGLICGIKGEDYHKNSRYRPVGQDGIGTRMWKYFKQKQEEHDNAKKGIDNEMIEKGQYYHF